ncbi:MAG: hypothetical protein U1E78_00655 [Gammaproteobacteria bacterium]
MTKYTLAELLKLEYAGIAPHLEGHLQQTISLLFGFDEHTHLGQIVCGQKPNSVFRLKSQERERQNPNEESSLNRISCLN